MKWEAGTVSFYERKHGSGQRSLESGIRWDRYEVSMWLRCARLISAFVGAVLGSVNVMWTLPSFHSNAEPACVREASACGSLGGNPISTGGCCHLGPGVRESTWSVVQCPRKRSPPFLLIFSLVSTLHDWVPNSISVFSFTPQKDSAKGRWRLSLQPGERQRAAGFRVSDLGKRGREYWLISLRFGKEGVL